MDIQLEKIRSVREAYRQRYGRKRCMIKGTQTSVTKYWYQSSDMIIKQRGEQKIITQKTKIAQMRG